MRRAATVVGRMHADVIHLAEVEGCAHFAHLEDAHTHTTCIHASMHMHPCIHAYMHTCMPTHTGAQLAFLRDALNANVLEPGLAYSRLLVTGTDTYLKQQVCRHVRRYAGM